MFLPGLYVFIDISSYLGGENENNVQLDVVFCEELLERKNVSMVPGTAFLSPGSVRISYSCPEKDIRGETLRGIFGDTSRVI